MSVSGIDMVAIPDITYSGQGTGTLYVYNTPATYSLTVTGTIPKIYYWVIGGGGGGGGSSSDSCGGGGSGSLLSGNIVNVNGTIDITPGDIGNAVVGGGIAGINGGISSLTANATTYSAYGGGGGAGSSPNNAGENSTNALAPYGFGAASYVQGGNKPGVDVNTGFGIGGGGGASTIISGVFGSGGGGLNASGIAADGGAGAAGAANGTSGYILPLSGSGFTPILVCSGGNGGAASGSTSDAPVGYGNGGNGGNPAGGINGTNGTFGAVILWIPSGNPPCFARGSRILCLKEGKEEYIPIEEIRKGDLVKTFDSSYIRVHTIGRTVFKNPDNADRGPNRLFRLTPANYPELTEDLIITGCHSRLVDKLEPQQKARHLKLMKTLYLTGDKFRLMAFIDEKAEPYIAPGEHEIWHFALENDKPTWNYGVYANGLLVETASIKNMVERSGLVPIE